MRNAVLLFTLFANSAFAIEKSTNRNALDPLFRAIKLVETGTRTSAFPRGDQGRSRGPYQIMRSYWQDSRVTGKYENVERMDYAQKVMIGYWSRYCPKALEKGDFETLSKVHNGGPAGPRKRATQKYWEKVKRELDNPRR